jgi:hypothetical protein
MQARAPALEGGPVTLAEAARRIRDAAYANQGVAPSDRAYSIEDAVLWLESDPEFGLPERLEALAKELEEYNPSVELNSAIFARRLRALLGETAR